MSDSEDYEFGREVIENEGVDEEFRNAILNAKKSLNNNIIDGPELYNTQDLNVLNDYIKSLNNLYILSIDAQKGINVINTKNLDLFPPESKNEIKIALHHIMNIFKNKSIVDIIPYSNYIWNSFKENQFVLNDNF
jgi:hypothetical protein